MLLHSLEEDASPYMKDITTTIQQEQNQIKRGKRSTIRVPKGKVLAHPRGKEAAKGYSYKETQLQLESNHKLQHKYDNNGKKYKSK